MVSRIVILISVGLLFVLSSCTTKHSEIVLAEYGDKTITMDEFEKAYAKNVGGFEEAKDDSLMKLKSFLDLYLNFKMKLKDAHVRNYNNDPWYLLPNGHPELLKPTDLSLPATYSPLAVEELYN